MGKNPIMEKSDAGAACLSWTFFFHNSVGYHRWIIDSHRNETKSGWVCPYKGTHILKIRNFPFPAQTFHIVAPPRSQEIDRFAQGLGKWLKVSQGVSRGFVGVPSQWSVSAHIWRSSGRKYPVPWLKYHEIIWVCLKIGYPHRFWFIIIPIEMLLWGYSPCSDNSIFLTSYFWWSESSIIAGAVHFPLDYPKVHRRIWVYLSNCHQFSQTISWGGLEDNVALGHVYFVQYIC